jgi:hypothetical protein
MLSFFNADISSPTGCPQNMSDILVGPLLFAFFGIMMFIASVRYEMSYDKTATWWKWCMAPLGIAILLGIQRVSFLNSFAYLQTVLTKKLHWSHWLSLIIPILCVASIILYKWRLKQNESKRVY